MWLGAALVATKAFYLATEAPARPADLGSFLAALAAVSHRDVLFAWALGLAHRLALAVAGAALGRKFHALFTAIYLASAAYAVVNLEVFGFFLTPLTYPLLWLAADLRSVLGAIAPFATLPVLAGIGGAALAWAGLAWASERVASRLAPRALGVLQAAALTAAGAWIAWGHVEAGADWRTRLDRRIVENPHWTFLVSFARAAISPAPMPLVAAPVTEGDLEDFLSIAERAERPLAADEIQRASLGPVASARGFRPQNVILLVLESVSARWLEPYGSPYAATPNLAAEAKHALVFDDFYAPVGRSSDALAAILLSAHPPIGWRDPTVEFPRLPGTSLAEQLEERGYRTAFLTSSDLGWADWDRFLEGRGFDTIRQQGDLGCGEPLTYWGVEDRCLVDAMIRWLDDDPSRPFFLMGWTVQTHHPYEPSPGVSAIDFFRGSLPPDDYDLGRYLNALHETDRHLGRLFAHLRSRGVDDETLVVVVGDHGEAFGHPHEAYGHGTTLYEEHVRVPLIVWNPRLHPRGARSKIIGSHVDLNATIADVLGISPAGSWRGRSLFDPDRPGRAYFFVAAHDYLLGVREERWKYVLDVSDVREELYDLRSDPDEQRNLASTRPDICRRLRQRLAARVEADRQLFTPFRRGS